jgi:hypothetical protein
MEKYEDNLHEDELSIWVDWLDAEDVLQPPQEAAEEAEIMVPGSVPDGEAGSEQAAMVRKYQQASSWVEAIALDKEAERGKKKAVAKMAKSSGSEQRPKSAAKLKKSLQNKRYREKKKLKAALALDRDFPAHAFAPDSVVLADGGAPAVLADAPLSVVLADGGAPAVLANAPAAVVLADAGAPAVLAFAPHSVVLADGGAPAVLAPAPHSVVLADGGAPAVLPKGRVCRFCKKKGHIKKTCPQNPDGRPRQDRRRKCFKCGSREHSAAACKAAPL